ncbi:MAG: hypothetical protein LBD71_04735 [Treponema sp.]|nr:hypothetical protein [Treponema sp.]
MAASGILLFFSSCGDLGAVLPSTGSYRVSAYVSEISQAGGFKSTLDETSIIGEDIEINPFFINSVTNDPDLYGLAVHLENKTGRIPGSGVKYVLRSYKAKEGNEDVLVYVGRLDGGFPVFPLPEKLEIGSYTMVFQVLGEKDILYRVEKPVYFTGNLNFQAGNIRCYLPYAADSQLIPPGMSVMLETYAYSSSADAEDTDPYVIWYSGKKRLSEGKISEGGGRFLWKAGDQTGFNTIRAELFPFTPEPEFRGVSREISLMISAKSKDSGYYRQEEESLAHWYQFNGDLHDTIAPTSTEKALIPTGGGSPRWLPEEGIYGLAVGPADAYMLEELSPPIEGERAGGRLMLHVKPAADGEILSSVFAAENSPEAAELTLYTEGGNLCLRAKTSFAAKTLTVPLPLNGGFISAVIDFIIRPGEFSAALVSETAVFSPLMLPFTAAVSGGKSFRLKESFRLGGAAAGSDQAALPAARQPAAEQEAETGLAPEPADVSAVIDEFAVSAVLPVKSSQSLGPF